MGDELLSDTLCGEQIEFLLKAQLVTSGFRRLFLLFSREVAVRHVYCAQVHVDNRDSLCQSRVISHYWMLNFHIFGSFVSDVVAHRAA